MARQLVPPAALGVSSEADSPEFCGYHGRLAAWYAPYAIMSLNAYLPDGLDDAAADAAVSCRDHANGAVPRSMAQLAPGVSRREGE